MAQYTITKEQYEKAVKNYALSQMRFFLIIITILLVIGGLTYVLDNVTSARVVIIRTVEIVIFYAICVCVCVVRWLQWLKKRTTHFNNKYPNGNALCSIEFSESEMIEIQCVDSGISRIALNEIKSIKEKEGYAILITKNICMIIRNEETQPILDKIKESIASLKKGNAC